MIPSYYHAGTSSEGSDRMRGPDEQTKDMFSYLSPEERVRPDHPLRAIRRMTGGVDLEAGVSSDAHRGVAQPG